MRSPVAGIVTLLVVFIVAIIGYSSVFSVQQTEQALVVRFGKPVDVVTDPGLHFKAPFIDAVIPVDKRILDLENPSQEVIASDQKRRLDPGREPAIDHAAQCLAAPRARRSHLHPGGA
jgi:membrane protease subunit HflC